MKVTKNIAITQDGHVYNDHLFSTSFWSQREREREYFMFIICPTTLICVKLFPTSLLLFCGVTSILTLIGLYLVAQHLLLASISATAAYSLAFELLEQNSEMVFK